MYSEKVMDHFENPRNVGEIPDANGVGTVGNAKCGDLMRMYLQVENGIIEDATLNDFKVGDRVFVKGVAGSTYGTVAELPALPKVDTHMTIETDDGQRITADIWETIKEY